MTDMTGTTDFSEDPWMRTSHCFPEDTVELGILVNGMSVIRNSAGVHLLGGQGHRGDIILTFPSPPVSDPTLGMDDEALDEETPENDALWEEFWQWKQNLDVAMAPFMAGYDLRGAYWLMEDLIKAGYNPHEDEFAEMWLYARAAKIVADYDAAHQEKAQDHSLNAAPKPAIKAPGM